MMGSSKRAKSQRSTRTRNYTAILYPESLPKHWIQLLERTQIPMAISPLHDRDSWTELDELENRNHKAGMPKKSHYHVILYFNAPKSPKQVIEILEPVGVKHVEPVHSTIACNRYLVHLDQPEKAQYQPESIQRLNGAKCDISDPAPTQDEWDEIGEEIIYAIRNLELFDYCEVIDYALDNGLTMWPKYMQRYGRHISEYLKSRRCNRGKSS